MESSWRNGFGLGRAWAWSMPLVSLALVALALAQAQVYGGDIRAGAFPWLMGLAALGLALLCVRVIEVHEPAASLPVAVGGWWTALAFLGVAGFFAAVGVGALFDIDEEAAGVLAWLPVISMAFGLLSMTPAVGLLALGTGRGGVVPRWGVGALWTLAPLLIVLLIFGGLAEGTAETVGLGIIQAVFALGWVVVGLAVRPAVLARHAESTDA